METTFVIISRAVEKLFVIVCTDITKDGILTYDTNGSDVTYYFILDGLRRLRVPEIISGTPVESITNNIYSSVLFFLFFHLVRPQSVLNLVVMVRTSLPCRQ